MPKTAKPICFNCNAPLDYQPGNVGRGETCPACGADVRVCRNCKHYDPSCYNECRESQADRVVGKDRANFCDYFTFVGGQAASGDQKNKTLENLDDLFKK